MGPETAKLAVQLQLADINDLLDGLYDGDDIPNGDARTSFQIMRCDLEQQLQVLDGQVLTLVILRIRRVKCDETKPFCIKYTPTGRTCEGYTPPPPRKPRTRPSKCDILQMRLERGVAVISGTSVPVLDSGSIYACYVPQSLDHVRGAVDRDEYRSLDYYRTRVSTEISGFFNTKIWKTLVL